MNNWRYFYMEQNQFEGLEEVEQEERIIPDDKPELKEYEKLLLAEHYRKLQERARKLIEFGCFNQEQVKTVDFSRLTQVPGPKFKGLYSLYQNIETLELVFVCPLVENNIGDEKEERKGMTPYAYDLIVIEHMDEETFQMVKQAAKNNIHTGVKTLYVLSIIIYLFVVALGLFAFGYYYFNNEKQGVGLAFAYALVETSPFAASSVIGLFLLVLATIKYKSYKEQ